MRSQINLSCYMKVQLLLISEGLELDLRLGIRSGLGLELLLGLGLNLVTLT